MAKRVRKDINVFFILHRVTREIKLQDLLKFILQKVFAKETLNQPKSYLQHLNVPYATQRLAKKVQYMAMEQHSEVL